MSIKTEEEFINFLIIEAKKSQKNLSTAIDIDELIEVKEVKSYLNSVGATTIENKKHKVISTIQAITYTGTANENPKGTIKGAVKYRQKNTDKTTLEDKQLHAIIVERINALLPTFKKEPTAEAFLKHKANKDISQKFIENRGGLENAIQYLQALINLYSVIGDIKTTKRNKFKRSGHLTNQLLSYVYPRDKQITLWDNIGEKDLIDIQEQEKNSTIERSQIIQGLKLSGTETKLVDSLAKLLHDKSQNLDSKQKNYYTGNGEQKLVRFKDETIILPQVACSLYELTQEYKGESTPSGKDVENVKNILDTLNDKNFYFKYSENHYLKKKGDYIKKEVEGVKKLIEVVQYTNTYVKGDIESFKRTLLKITLHPIFQRQIDTNFILYPSDINKRTAIAYGGEKISAAAFKLRDSFLVDIKYKTFTREITKDRLSYLLAEKYMNESRKKRVNEEILKAIETCKNLGILLSWELVTGKTGEPKYIFKLNKNWE